MSRCRRILDYFLITSATSRSASFRAHPAALSRTFHSSFFPIQFSLFKLQFSAFLFHFRFLSRHVFVSGVSPAVVAARSLVVA